MTANSRSRIESEIDVDLYLKDLVSALDHHNGRISFQMKSSSNQDRNERYTNRFTINHLFSNEDIPTVLKRELKLIRIENYIMTVIDREFPAKLEFRVFGKYYDDDVYIKMRVEQEGAYENNPLVYLISFHYAMYEFHQNDFPYKGADEYNEI